MQTQLILILSVTVALTFVLVGTAIGLVIHKSVNAQTMRQRQRLYTHYSDRFAEILLADLPPTGPNSRTSAIFKQYESLIEPIKVQLAALSPKIHTVHRETVRQVLIDFARDLSGEAIDRLVYCFYSMDFVSEQIALLNNKLWWVRAQAAKDLALLRTRRALAALTAALEDPHPDVRDQARRAIATIAGAESLRTIFRLTKRMSNWTALELSIAVMQYKEDAIPFLLEALRLNDQSVVLFAIEMLAEIGFVSAVDPLMSLAGSYPNVVVRGKAIEALGRLGDQRAEELLMMLSDNPNPMLRIRAIEALARIGVPIALPTLLKRLAHSTLPEQVASARAIGRTGTQGIAALRQLAQQGAGKPRAVSLQVLEELS
jgi:HEAT repeat protein